MKWMVKKAIKGEMPGGKPLRIEHGRIIDMPPYRAMRYVATGRLQFIDEVDGPSPEQRKTFDEVMTSTILHFRDKIIASKSWRPNDKTHEAERIIEEIQKDIMKGGAKLLDFRQVCQVWYEVGLKGGAQCEAE